MRRIRGNQFFAPFLRRETNHWFGTYCPSAPQQNKQFRATLPSYLFFPESKVGCHAMPFRLGAAAITLIFSFLGFLASRFPFCWPFAMSVSFG